MLMNVGELTSSCCRESGTGGWRAFRENQKNLEKWFSRKSEKIIFLRENIASVSDHPAERLFIFAKFIVWRLKLVAAKIFSFHGVGHH